MVQDVVVQARGLSGRVSISSCGSIPALGLPVMLRMLSAPAPREVSPSSSMRAQHVDRMRRADLADLQIGAGRDVEIAAAEPLGDIGTIRDRLVGRQNAARQPQAEHERVLIRGDVKQAVEFVPEDVEALRETARPRRWRAISSHMSNGCFVALGELFGRQLSACRDDPILRLQMDRARVAESRPFCRYPQPMLKSRASRCRVSWQSRR